MRQRNSSDCNADLMFLTRKGKKESGAGSVSDFSAALRKSQPERQEFPNQTFLLEKSNVSSEWATMRGFQYQSSMVCFYVCLGSFELFLHIYENCNLEYVDTLQMPKSQARICLSTYLPIGDRNSISVTVTKHSNRHNCLLTNTVIRIIQLFVHMGNQKTTRRTLFSISMDISLFFS